MLSRDRPIMLPSSRCERVRTGFASPSASCSSFFARRCGASRKIMSSTCSVVRRSRSHITLRRRSATSGLARTNGTKSRRSIARSSHSTIATASAVRSLPSSSAISPKTWPSSMTLNTTWLPSGPAEPIRTLPLSTAKRPRPGEPLIKICWRARKLSTRAWARSCAISPAVRLPKRLWRSRICRIAAVRSLSAGIRPPPAARFIRKACRLRRANATPGPHAFMTSVTRIGGFGRARRRARHLSRFCSPRCSGGCDWILNCGGPPRVDLQSSEFFGERP